MRNDHKRMKKIIIVFFIVLNGFMSCDHKKEMSHQFELLTAEHTGLLFNNNPIPSQYFNAFNFMYFYNGGGVAVGDFNNDGLQDIFFTSNMEANKMFLNEGNLKFRDITEQAGIEGIDGWTTGTCVVDINNDGLLDIYVCQIGEYATIRGKNQLFVCQGIEDGIPVYLELAADYGIDFSAFSTQAAFFDYDLDGDLDMFLMNYSLHQNGTFGQRHTFIGKAHPTSGDKLLRNDNGKFVEVTQQAGIHSMVIGYGLGIVTSDFNMDGWPDIYIGNDFHENDYLYINQQDGTFKEVISEQMMHTSRFSMGVDAGDINNDGLIDIFSLDMMPEDPIILKSSLGEDELGVFNFKLGYGYNHQYARNNLQLNNGDNTFSEIGMYAGVYATDWSWAPLLFDFNHDGYKDLFISNGIPRRMNDIDYVNWREKDEDFKWKAQLENLEEKDLVAIEQMPEIKLPNKFYENTANLRFIDISKKVSGNMNTYSNGAAYADFDNDGDLDIVVNNCMDNAYIYKNLTVENNHPKQNYLAITPQDMPGNINGIGTKGVIFKGQEVLIYENFPVRGYQSSVEIGLHMGLGDTANIDSILIIWPDHKYQLLDKPAYNTSSSISYDKNAKVFDFANLRPKKKSLVNFSDVTQETKINFRHIENEFVEFKRERLMPHVVSTEGPALAVGDINGDGLEDFFIGNSKRENSALFLQNEDGTFYEKYSPLLHKDSTYEDVNAVFADIDNDGDLDLVIASGGNEYWGESEYLMQRIYINDGSGNFNTKITFDNLYMTASCVLPYDFNNDGLVDFFIGGRAVPKSYGVAPTSYLLQNKGDGSFENVTEKISTGLSSVGMVKDGIWIDIDNDGDKDLVLAIEWDHPKVFLNQNGKFEPLIISDYTGWWNFILPYDFDGDGDTDFIFGNTGENHKLKPTKEQPIRMYVKDFDNNGQIDQVLTYFVKDKEIPFANYQELTNQFAFLKKRYPSSRDLAADDLNTIFGKKNLKESSVLESNMFSSILLENTGNLTFKSHRLPDMNQFSTLNAGVVLPFNDKSKTFVMLGGNFYGSNIEMGRSDASYGNMIIIDKNNKMTSLKLGELVIKGQIRKIMPIQIKNVVHYLIARNDDSLLVIKPEFEIPNPK